MRRLALVLTPPGVEVTDDLMLGKGSLVQCAAEDASVVRTVDVGVVFEPPKVGQVSHLVLVQVSDEECQVLKNSAVETQLAIIYRHR